MKPTKAMTLRLSADQAEALETVATVEEKSVADVIRTAISNHIQGKTKEPAFQDSLRLRLNRASRLLRGR